MRLRRLDLTRYGKFTDRSIDFGETVPGTPDLHIVYGPNEAGKSTAFSAFLDVLFGIDVRSRYGFFHPYTTMRIGAALELAGGVREFIRLKRPTNSLLDATEQPVPEIAIRGELGGIDRTAYLTMFSLDDETLEAGGKSILASKGDLGQLLFSASAGLADLSSGLDQFRGEADRFYKFRSRGGELADLKARLGSLKEERDRIDTFASQYAQLVEVRDSSQLQYQEAVTARSKTQTRIDEIRRFLNALPRLAALRAVRDRLEPLADLPEAPFGWSEELPKLQREEIELATRHEAIIDEIAQLTSDLAGLVVDETATGLSERVERLADLRARYVTAEKDLPDRRLQLREAEFAISGLLTRVDRQDDPNPAGLLLGASVIGALRQLIESRSGIDGALRSSDDELVEARRRFEDIQAELAAAGGETAASRSHEPAIAGLATVVAVVRGSDHAARYRAAGKSKEILLETLADRLLELRPWTGDLEQLAKMKAIPAEDIERWRREAGEAERRVERLRDDVERLTTERTRPEAEKIAIERVMGVVADEEAGAVRAAREQAWADHRRALDATSADVFERSLRRDDLVTNARLAHTTELATLHQTARTIALLDAELAHTRQMLEPAEATLRSIRDDIAIAVSTMAPALPADITLPQIETWLGRRERALEIRVSLLALERDLREADQDSKAVREKLLFALDAAGFEHPETATIETLLLVAQAAIDQDTVVKGLRDAVAERQLDLASRERAAEKAKNADQAWRTAWSKVCSGCWLGEGGAVPPREMVGEILSALADLGPALERRAGLSDRIEKMKKDQAMFVAEVEAIGQELKLSVTSGGILDVAKAIVDHVQSANATLISAAAAGTALIAAEKKQRALGETLKTHGARKAEMTSFFSVETSADVGAALLSIQKKAELREQEITACADIIEALRMPNLDEAEHALESADRTALETELAELEARVTDQDQRSRELFSAHSKAADRVQAVGGDDAVAKIEEQRRTTLLEIEDKAIRYLKVRVGVLAADQALRAYRDKHRSSMMARASAAFQTISRGAYTGLASQPDKDSETLIALSAGGGSKHATELSKGTQFQLYMALRVAGYHEFARSNRPVPFIADDIMETFDDFRAEEAFRLFADMAAVGQVIYLTHHRHLCEIAQRVCPTAQLHNL